MSQGELERLHALMQRAQRIASQQPKDKGKLYALHAPEVECIGKGKVKKPCEFGVKTAVAVTFKRGLMMGARTFPGTPYDGHILSAQIEQTNILLQDIGVRIKRVTADLGFRGVDAENPGIDIAHRGKIKIMTDRQRRELKRRQEVEPAIGHFKSDHRMDRCWLKGQIGDAMQTVLCAVGFNIRWLMRAALRLGLKALYLCLLRVALLARLGLAGGQNSVSGLAVTAVMAAG